VPLDLVLALKDMTAFADCPTGISFLFNGPDQPATATMALVTEEGQVFQRVEVVVQIHCSLSYRYLSTGEWELGLYPVGWLLMRGSPQEKAKLPYALRRFPKTLCTQYVEKDYGIR
jgi:hypothetical protein